MAALVQDETGEISYYDMPLNLNSINDYYHKKLTPKAAQEFISKRTGGIEVSQAKNAKEAGYAVFGKELNHFLKTIQKNSGDDWLKLCLLIYSAGIKSDGMIIMRRLLVNSREFQKQATMTSLRVL